MKIFTNKDNKKLFDVINLNKIRDAILNNEKPERRHHISKEYKEVEYIKSDGYQWIDTGIIDDDNTIIQINGSFINIENNKNYLMGSSKSNLQFGVSNGKWIHGINEQLLNNDYNGNMNYFAVNKKGLFIEYIKSAFSPNLNIENNLTYFLFGRNDENLDYCLCNFVLKDAKIYQNNILVRDFYPVVKLSDGSVGLFDKIEEKFYGNLGTKDFTYKDFNRKLFNDYTELEYIDTTGTQYVDTEICPTRDTEWWLDIMLLKHGNQTWDIPFGSKANNAQSSLSLTATSVMGDYGNSSYTTKSFNTLNRFIVEYRSDGNYMYRYLSDGSSTSYTSRAKSYFSGTNPYPLLIGGFHNNSSAFEGRDTQMRWYEIKISNNGVLLRDFIPCKNINNEIGFYDIITNKFYDNSGEGEFVGGPEVIDNNILETIYNIQDNENDEIEYQWMDLRKLLFTTNDLYTAFDYEDSWGNNISYFLDQLSLLGMKMLFSKETKDILMKDLKNKTEWNNYYYSTDKKEMKIANVISENKYKSFESESSVLAITNGLDKIETCPNKTFRLEYDYLYIGENELSLNIEFSGNLIANIVNQEIDTINNKVIIDLITIDENTDTENDIIIVLSDGEHEAKFITRIVKEKRPSIVGKNIIKMVPKTSNTFLYDIDASIIGINEDSISVSISNPEFFTIDGYKADWYNKKLQLNLSSPSIKEDLTDSVEIILEDKFSNETTFETILENKKDYIYQVDNISTAYGFYLNDNDYYESNVKGSISSKWALCKITFQAPDKHLYLDCINSSYATYNFGILSNIDTTLTDSYNEDSVNVFKSFKGLSSTDVVSVDYGTINDSNEHFIYVKYIRKSNTNQGNNSLQFKVRFE